MNLIEKYDKQIELIDSIYQSLKNKQRERFLKIRDRLAVAFFKEPYFLKEDFTELFPYDKARLVYNTLNSIQKAGVFADDSLTGAGGNIKIEDALLNLDYIKGVLSAKKESLKTNDESSNDGYNDRNGTPEDINSKEEKGLPVLVKDLIEVCRIMQGNPYYLGGKSGENEKNTYIRDIMRVKQYNVDDQTLQGISAKGKGPGELDLLITEKSTNKNIVIEGLNLTYLNTRYIKEHFDRVFKYDTYGNIYNVELVYCNIKDLADIKQKYKKTIENYKSDKVEEVQSNSSKLFILRSHQLINQKDNYIFHLLIQLAV